jgi:tripartite-type tricarboxylate transporter receptor subunit TctC
VSTALLGGQIVAGSFSAGGWAQHVQAGTMRLIASFQHDRFSVAPDVPTLDEMGYGLVGTNIQFLYGPKGLPPAVAKRLIAVFTEAARSPTYVQIATKNELYDKDQLVGAALTDYLLKDRATNSALVKKLGLKKQR